MKNTKCRLCPVCNGKACLNELPGMGGVGRNENFILNVAGWKTVASGTFGAGSKPVRLAPMTGGVENCGWQDEKSFYFDMMGWCAANKVPLSIGDGAPDEKLWWGIEAVSSLGKKAAVFIKPYSNMKILERLERALSVAEAGGIDIDAYNIVTMRNKANLEKKTPELLLEIKEFLNKNSLPFAVKGIFTREDLELVELVKPDIAFVSNHGGRVENRRGSTAEFLSENASFLRKYSGSVWVDGGIRDQSDVEKAFSLGADEVLAGRPFVQKVIAETFGN